MDTNITTILISTIISVGVSAIMTGIYWGGKGIVNRYQKHKTFITYKKYIEEFFELYLIALDTNKITYEKTIYEIADLEFHFIIEDGNESEKISKPQIPTLILAFISGRELFSDNERALLISVLGSPSSETWILIRKKVDKDNKIILFSQLGVYSPKTSTTLGSLKKDHYIYSPSSQDTIKKLQTQFKHKEFDKRIKKIIKKNLKSLS